ncbi:MAG TPA: cation-translocating P-type ATPase [Longimicrobiales bacterium]|nr:cation-translocating P-type ATPase [Longimicrobiales bacterium]
MSGSERAGTVIPPGGTEARTRFDIPDMDCPSCVAKIQGHLRKLDGVLDVEGSPVARTLTVAWDAELLDQDRVRAEVGRLGYEAWPRDGSPPPPPPSTWAGRQARIAYASVGLFLLGLVARLVLPGDALLRLPLSDLTAADLFFVLSALVGGWNFFPKGLRAARALALDMNFLMTLAILGALAIGETMEAAAIAFLFALAELLESYAVDRARGSVEALMELAPETARRIDGEGRERTVPASALAAGDVVAVRPGERVPADGTVAEGRSAVDESPITGESMPADKVPGDPVYAGTINREGYLRLRVDRPVEESTLARIVRLVEAAEGRRTRAERFVDRFARWYTPAVTLGALLVVLVPTLLFGAPFVPWFVRGLTLLVIACPCALVISTPVAVVSGVTAAARHGVLIKGGVYLEALGEVETFALDKTGTLTFGRPRVVDVLPRDGVSAEALLARAAAVEDRSEHPLARAIVEHADALGLTRAGAVTGFQSVPGRGALAEIDGVQVRVGRAEMLGVEGAASHPPAVDGGRTVVGVATGGEVLGWIVLADRARDAAHQAVAGLRAEGVRRIVMLTGDQVEAAESVGRALGVDEVRARLLPEDKVDAVKELEARYGPVAMVGDGVNDAPALAAATVGVAMGAMGTDAALETADVALMGDDLTRLPYVRRLSTRARRVIRQNIAAAILVKAVLAVGVPLGLVSLVAAVVIGDLGVSLAVTLNALRLGGAGGRAA